MADTVRFYQDAAGEWRWRRKAANGETVADSGEGYVNLADCEREGRKVNSGPDVEFVYGFEGGTTGTWSSSSTVAWRDDG